MTIKRAWIVFLVTLLIALPTRIYQILFLVDQGTGFYTDGLASTMVIAVALAIGAIAIVILCARDKRVPVVYHPMRSLPAAVTGALAGGAMLFGNGYWFLKTFINWYTKIDPDGRNFLMDMLLGLTGILGGAVILRTAWDHYKGTNTFQKWPVLALVPSLWGCISLVTLFITFTAVVNIAENVYDTFTVVFTVIFLFMQAKLMAGIDDKKSSRAVFMYGLPAVLLSLVTGFSGGLTQLLGLAQTSSYPVVLHIVNGLLALYIIAFLSTLWHSQMKAVPPVELELESEPEPEPVFFEMPPPEKATDPDLQATITFELPAPLRGKPLAVVSAPAPISLELDRLQVAWEPEEEPPQLPAEDTAAEAPQETTEEEAPSAVLDWRHVFGGAGSVESPQEDAEEEPEGAVPVFARTDALEDVDGELAGCLEILNNAYNREGIFTDREASPFSGQKK